MRETAKILLSRLGYYRHLRKIRGGTTLLVLMYHDFADDPESMSIGSILRERISRAQFEAHIDALSRNYRVISIEQAVHEMRDKSGLKEDTVSITLDDGYRSVYEIAYPILLKYGIPATVYLTTDWINGSKELWWEQLADMIAGCDIQRLACGDLGRIPEIDIQAAIAAERDPTKKKIMLYGLLASHFRNLDDAQAKLEVDRLRDLCDPESTAQPPPLTWAQIAEMDKNAIRFGSHTRSHLNVSHAELELVEQEIIESREEIEKHIGSDVEGFAFPYGQDISSYGRIQPILARHGFSYACTAVPGNNGEGSNLYALLRETLPPTESKALLEREILLDLMPERRT